MREISLDAVAAPPSKRFGTFLGVFTPSLLTILGVIMYQRLGWVVGELGQLGAFGVVALAHVISVTTGLSVASIATNHTVRTGGNYYIISRSLGLSVGGAIGLALYVALALGVSLYIIGFAEGFMASTGLQPMGSRSDSIRLIGSAALFVLAVLTLWSTEIAVKSQVFVLIAIVGSLLAIVFGHPVDASPELTDPGPSASFAAVFAVFFPAVTGFTAGVGMSGDLKDPKKAIPVGTMAAIGVGLLIYLGLVWLLSHRVDPAVLRSDYDVLLRTAADPRLVTAGVFAATLSSALGSMLGAPRTLQALALDGIVPRLFGRGEGEPRIALVATLIIAEGGILMAELELVGAVITMFFLTCYGFLCLACGLERWASADFRPQFKVPVWVSLGGALACFLVMFQINALSMFAAIALMGVMYAGIKRRQLVLGTGDTWGGVWSAVIRAGLMRLQSSTSKSAQRNWRPNMLVVGRSRGKNPLLDFGRDLVGDRGLLTHVHLVEGDHPRPRADRGLEEAYPGVFARIQGCDDVYEAIPQMAAHFGLAGMETNAILMGWPREAAQRRRYGEMIDRLLALDLSVLMLRWDENRGFGARERIDVWWDGEAPTGTLMLTLAHLLVSSPEWKNARIRILVNGRIGQDDERARRALDRIISDARVPAKGEILPPVQDQEALASRIRVESARADLVFIHALEAGVAQGFVPTNDQLMRSLGTTLLVRPSSFFAQSARVFDPSTIDIGQVDDQVSVPSPVPALTGPLERFQEQLSSVSERHVKSFDEPAAAEERALLEDALVAVDEIRQLERRLGQRGDRQAAARELVEWASSRFASTMIERMRAPFGARGGSGLRLGPWDKRLQVSLDRLSEDVDIGLSRLPEQVVVPTDASDWLTRKDDPWRLRLFKGWVRFASGVLKLQRPRRKVDVRGPGRRIFASALAEPSSELVRAPALRRQQAVLRYRRVILEVQRFFEQLRAEVDRSEAFDVDAFSRTMRGQLQGIEDLITTQSEAWDAEAQSASRVARRALQAGAARLVDVLEGARASEERSDAPAAPGPSEWAARHRAWVDLVRLELQLEACATDARRATTGLAQRVRREVSQGPLAALVRAREVIGRVVELQEQHEDVQVEPGRFLEIADELRAAYDATYRPALQEMTDALVTQLGRGTDRLPAQVVVPGQVDEPTEDPRSASVTLMARRSAQAFLEARVANPVRSALEELPVAVRAAEATLVDAVRLVAFELEQAAAVGRDGADEQEAEEAGTLALGGLLEERIRRLEEAERSLSDAVSEWERVWMDASTEALTELRDVVLGRGEPGAVAGRFSWLHVVERAAERVQTAGRTLALKARRAASRAPPTTEPSTIVEELLLLRQRLSPDPGLQAKLPLLYRRMFGRAALETPDLVVGRVHELARLAGLVERWRSGSPGPIGIIGDPRCGRTTFANTWMRSQERPVIRVPPPTSGTVEELNAAVARAAGARDGQSAEGALRGLAPGAVVYVDELGGWLERSPGGLLAARAWFRLFRRLSDRHLFLVTGNSFAFELGEAALGIDPLFAGTVTLGPLAPSDLEALLLLRQRTSDFELEFVSRRRLGGDRPGAQLERLHRQSFGNPGEALDLWRRSIVDVTEQRIKLYVSQAPDTGVLTLLPEAWCAALSTIVLHRSVNAARLARTLRIGRDEAQSLLGDLGRAKLVRSERTGVWDLDPILQGPVTRALRGRGFVP